MFWTCFEVIFPVKILPSAPWGVKKRKDGKKWKISIILECPKLFPMVSKHVLNMFWGNFFQKENRQCTLEGRRLEKTLKKGKTSKFSKLSKNVPKNHCLRIFWLIFSTKKAQPSAPWRLKKNPKIEKTSNCQNPQKPYPKRPNLLEVVSWIFLAQCNQEIATCKNSKKRKNFETSKVSKNVLKSVQTSLELVLR